MSELRRRSARRSRPSSQAWRSGELAAPQLSLPFNFLQERTESAAAPPAASHVYTIPPSAPFLPSLIRALRDGRLIEGFTPGPLDWADVTIFLPTRRACRLVRDAFLPVLGVDAAVLPRIVPLGDIDEDEFAFSDIAPGALAAEALALPPALAPLERRLLLAHLVRRWAERIAPQDQAGSTAGSVRDAGASPVARHPAAAIRLADDLARLMDDMTTREVPWSRLDGLVPGELDRYWQLTLQFLTIARDHWPAILAERGVIEEAERRDRLITAEAARLAANPARPVIAAGSTGSMPSTAKLLAAIARLPRGAVVLPGLDTALDEESWNAIGGAAAPGRPALPPAPGHPQAAMHRLLGRMGLARRDVQTLVKPQPHGRETLLSEALRPAAATDKWRGRLDAIGAAAGPAFDGIAVVEAANAEEEAAAIAVALREAAMLPERTAALVTPDRALARRVAVMLRRWNIEPEISDRTPLAETAAGVFCRLTAEAALSRLAPVPLLALLKHPLTRFGSGERLLERGGAALEHAILRGPRPAPGSRGLVAAFGTFRGELAKLKNREHADIHRSDPRASLAPWEIDDAAELLERITDALEPLESVAAAASGHDFAGLAARHWEAVRRAAIDEAGEMFAGPDGDAIARAFADIAETAAGVPYEVRPDEYLDVFAAAIDGRKVDPRTGTGSPIRIYGQLEARLTGVDRIILGGLVEGVWPPDARSDPWLSRPMRLALGLDPPERRIGLAAHDFAQLLGAPEVMLTWPAKRGGAPAVASRFVQRLGAVAGDAAWRAAVARGDHYRALARLLDAPVGPPRPAPRPEPRPPRAARPAQLSVTEIEHWLRDPYTIYARHVLKLPRLDPVDAPPGGAERGSFIHAAIGDFATVWADALPPDPYGELIRLGRKHFARVRDFPEAHAFWWPRYERIARWFADFETKRRTGMAAAHAEIRGELTFPAGERSFRLTGRADRIEQLKGGGYAVLDFKTGAPPSATQVQIGLSPQLTLEAAMLREGAFPGVASGASVAELVYVRLNGGHPAGEERIISLKDRTPDDAADAALAELKALVIRFEDEATPYRPLVLSMWKNRYGAYDDLARVKEWSLSGGEEGEE